MMAVLVVCLLASFAIGIHRLATTPQEIFTPTSDSWNSLRWPER